LYMYVPFLAKQYRKLNFSLKFNLSNVFYLFQNCNAYFGNTIVRNWGAHSTFQHAQTNTVGSVISTCCQNLSKKTIVKLKMRIKR